MSSQIINKKKVVVRAHDATHLSQAGMQFANSLNSDVFFKKKKNCPINVYEIINLSITYLSITLLFSENLQ